MNSKDLPKKLTVGHFIQLDTKSKYDHYFGGENRMIGGECPNCNKPIPLYLSLDTSDERLCLESADTEYLRLLFCMRCDIQEQEFVYRMVSDNEIEIQEYCPGTAAITKLHQHAWYEEDGFSDEFPRRDIALQPIPERLQELIDEWATDRASFHGWDEIRSLKSNSPANTHLRTAHFNQIGGFGYVSDPAAIPPNCTVCDKLGLNKATEFLAVLVNSDPLPGKTERANYMEYRQFAVCRDGIAIAFAICSFCTAIHAVALA